jgi:hypothetical protein
MMIIARAGLFEHIYCIKFEIVTCHTQLSNLEMMHIRAVKCVQGQVQHTLSEVQVLVNAEFEATISARVSPIITAPATAPAINLNLESESGIRIRNLKFEI